jgi:membrane dipeptidase
MVSLPELRNGDIGLVVATQIARFVGPDNPLPGWHSQEQAWAQTQGQFAWYKAMEEEGEMIQIKNLSHLENHVNLWNSSPNQDKKPIGFILSLEGADSLVRLKNLEIAFDQGLRALGPAHYGPGVYAQGTDALGELSPKGKELIRELERFNIILDTTHLSDESFWDALGRTSGPVWASHSNCRALVNHNRQFTDDQIRELIRRDAVIGAPLDAWMMVPHWIRGESNPGQMQCSLDKMIDHIDHICQIAGNSLHIGIGSDLDGGFGREQAPYDMESIRDLNTLPHRLQARGYDETAICNFMHGNWLRFLRRVWA